MPKRPESFLERLRKQQRRIHGGREVNPREAAFYRRRSWRAIRRVVLRQEPYCADPFGVHAKTGRPAASVHVDHIVPLRQRPDLGLVRSNLQGLCASCHSIKTTKEGVTY